MSDLFKDPDRDRDRMYAYVFFGFLFLGWGAYVILNDGYFLIMNRGGGTMAFVRVKQILGVPTYVLATVSSLLGVASFLSLWFRRRKE